jgi:hypothetical protein
VQQNDLESPDAKTISESLSSSSSQYSKENEQPDKNYIIPINTRYHITLIMKRLNVKIILLMIMVMMTLMTQIILKKKQCLLKKMIMNERMIYINILY